MKACLRLTLFICLLLPILSAAQAPPVLIPNYECCAGRAFTIRIPVTFPKSMSLEYVWYRENTAKTAAAILPSTTRIIEYTVPAGEANGDSVVFYFKYRLSDELSNEWSTSRKYMLTFPGVHPAASAITGSTTACSGTTGLTYSVDDKPSVTYAWAVPSGWTITAGQGSYSITVTATTSAASGDISVTPHNGCGTGTPQTLAVAVNQASTLTLSSGSTAQTVCQNSAITNIVYARGGSATSSSISWLPSIPAGISYNTSTNTISGTPTGSGAFTYTVTTSGHTSPCTAATATGTITVSAASTLTRSGGAASQSVCSSAITSIAYTRGGSATGSSIEWSPSKPDGISDSEANGVRTISGTPTSYGAFTYTITTTGHTSPCTAVTLSGTITAQQASTLTRSGGAASQTVCQNTAITNIVYARGGSATGSSISWSPSTPAGISYNTTTGAISGTPTGSGAFTYTVTTSGHTSPCAAATATGTITVNATATLARSGGAASQTVCQGAVTDIVYTRGGGATGFAAISWSPSTPAGVSVSGGGSGTTYTIGGTPTSFGAFTYTVATTGGSCAATATGDITRGGVSSVGTASFAAYSCSGGITNAGTTSFAAYSCSGGITNAGTASFAAYSCSGGISNAGSITFAPAN